MCVQSEAWKLCGEVKVDRGGETLLVNIVTFVSYILQPQTADTG